MSNKIRILLLAGNTLRARAYAQQLEHLSSADFEINGLLYGYGISDCSTPALDDTMRNHLKQEKLFIPDFEENLEDTFGRNRWNLQKVVDKDVNSVAVLSEISKFSYDIIIYAGYGGQLLKDKHFQSKVQYLHMHPGRLPSERGSTTIYYSILNRKVITVTAFYMTEDIDLGKNIIYCEYSVPPRGVNIDLWLDNVIRADCLLKALENIMSNKSSDNNVQDVSEEYYIIHPVLKHVALLSLADI